ncbi:MAG TPA: endonuclease [Verrucomicrobiae bacterium]|nr:endonuclease [Verrucomicrobiae bacterium]
MTNYLCRRVRFVFGLVVLFPILSSAQVLPPYSYYAPASNVTGSALATALHGIIQGQTVIPYSSSSFDTHDALCVLDRDPTNSGNVIEIYSGFSVDTNTWPSWNREHLYCESFGTDSGTQHSDLFNLRACDEGVNSSRGNKYYDVSTGSITYPPGAPGTSYDGDSWEPRDADKGFVARGCFYMSTRYNGTGGDANLQLADSPNAGASIFAKLSTMLAWNRKFPPSAAERTRNGQIYQLYQHNRNPFIDNPDYADMVFLGVDGFTAWENDHFSTSELSNTAVVAETADPDGDGLPNLAEYVFGHDPHTNDSSYILSLTNQVISGANYLVLTHHLNHYLSGVTVTYQVSTDLVVWADTSAQVVTNWQIDTQKDAVTVRLAAPGPREFVRLKLHRVADVQPTDGALDVEPLQNFVSSGSAGGPFAPAVVTYTLTNVGVSNLNWTASNGQSWLTLSVVSGSLIPGASVTVTASVTVAANSLTPATYTDSIQFVNTSNHVGDTTRSAMLVVINQAPVIAPTGMTLVAESCTPANGAIDPGETVTVNFSLENIGSGDTSNLVATLVESDNIVSPSAPQTYGDVAAGGPSVTESYTFTAQGTCGSTIVATLQLQDGVTDLGSINYSFQLGAVVTPLSENFDEVTPPAIPSGWMTSVSGAESSWVTSTGAADSAPNAAFCPDANGAGIAELDSPAFTVHSASAQLVFRQQYSLLVSPTNSALGYDGGVLEISIGGGGYQDIVAAGGSFSAGGYNAMLSGDYSNPLAGQSAWSGDSGGFISTVVNLPAAAAGQTVQLRWRCATGATPTFGSSGTMAFWNFDATNGTAASVSTGLTATPFVVGNLGASGSLTFFSGNPGQAAGASAWTNAAGPVNANYSFFGFSLSTTNGSVLNLTNLSFDDRGSTTGPSNFTVQVSQQANFSSVIYNSGIKNSHLTSGSTFATETQALSNPGLTGTVYFRVYGFKSSGTSGTWRLDNVNLQGSVSGGLTLGGGWYIDSISVNDTTCCTGP